LPPSRSSHAGDRVAFSSSADGTGELVTGCLAPGEGLEIERVSASIARKALEEQVAVLHPECR